MSGFLLNICKKRAKAQVFKTIKTDPKLRFSEYHSSSDEMVGLIHLVYSNSHLSLEDLLDGSGHADGHDLDGVVPELDESGLGVVVEEDAPPDGVEVYRRDVDGGEHVLEHGRHQRHVSTLFSLSLLEPVEDQERGVDVLLVVCHLTLQGRAHVSGQGVVVHSERQRGSSREPAKILGTI